MFPWNLLFSRLNNPYPSSHGSSAKVKSSSAPQRGAENLLSWAGLWLQLGLQLPIVQQKQDNSHLLGHFLTSGSWNQLEVYSQQVSPPPLQFSEIVLKILCLEQHRQHCLLKNKQVGQKVFFLSFPKHEGLTGRCSSGGEGSLAQQLQ